MLPFKSLVIFLALFCLETARAGLIAWYKFDEGSGVDVTDSSGRGNDLSFEGTGQSWTAKGGATFPNSGGSLFFNGSGGAVAQDSPFAPNIQTQTISWIRSRSGGKATVAFWTNTDVTNGRQAASPFFLSNLNDANAWQRILQAHVLWTDGNAYFDADNDGNEAVVAPATSGYSRLSAASTLSTNTWTHWAFVLDSSAGTGAMKIYRNGTQLGAGASVFTGNLGWQFADRLELGGGNKSNWTGALDDFALWDEALTPAQITSIYSGGVAAVFKPSIETFSASPGNVATAGSPLVLQWALAEGPVTSLTLNPGNVDLLPKTLNRTGSLTINPLSSGTYTLTATGPGGTSTSSVLIGVGLGESDFRINEFMADNDSTLFDEDGEPSDWIEIHNPNGFSKSLAGWKLGEGGSVWTFPAISVPAQGYLLVFASGQDRADPARQLHTNFKLPREGGVLALLRPDGTSSASVTYPAQNPSYSYGGALLLSTSASFVAPGQSNTLRYLVPTSTTPATWNTADFDDSTWTAANNTAIGFDSDETTTVGSTSFLPYITVNLGKPIAGVPHPMYGVNPSLYARYSFDVADKSAIGSLLLKIRYEDGFVAWLNGVEVARGNFTGTPAYNSGTTARTEADALKVDTFDVSGFGLSALRNGKNVLAIQGVNGSASSNDFLLAPALDAAAVQFNYAHMIPTPGAVNGSAATPGPLVAVIRHTLADTLGQTRQPVRPGLVSGTTVADSIDQFSTTQGQNGWTYGYFAGLTTAYAGTFTQITTTFDYGTYGVGYGAASPPYTRIAADLTHPNGSASTGGVQSTVRRWTSTFAGPAVIEGFVHHIANAGDGTRWQVFKNGAALLDGDSATAGSQPLTVKASLQRFAVNTTLAVGDRVDIVCDPGAASADASDSSRSWLRIRQNPAVENPAVHDTTLPVTATLLPTVDPVVSANLIYVIDFGNEVTLPMAAGANNVWTASIPLASVRGGQLIRWRVTATDSAARTTTYPPYLNTLDSPKYDGTVAFDPDLANQTRLNVLHLFTATPDAIAAATGGRASLFWNGVLYDNISMDIHGSTAAYAKKSYDVDFNQGHRFRFTADGAGHSDINLITNWRDRGKFRNPLAYGLYREAGVVTHHAETVRMQFNGLFHSTIDLIGELNDGLLKDYGKDPGGSLYKSQNDYNETADATTGIEKKNRKYEGNTDLLNLINGIMTGYTAATTSVPPASAVRDAFFCDNVDLPATVNFMAAMNVSTSTDWGHKNYMIWRDSGKTDLWAPLPWDLDLSFAHKWNGTESYFDDDLVMFADDRSANFDSTPNGLFRHFWEDATLNGMRIRRTRTLLDKFWATTSVPTLEQRLDAIADRIDPPAVAESDADLDLRIWGFWNQHYATYVSRSMRNEMDRIKASFLPAQRNIFLNNSPAMAPVAYASAPTANPAIRFGNYDSNPAGNDQRREYIEIVNQSSEFVDLSGWSLTGGVSFTFPAGAVISPSGNSRFNGRLYIPKSVTGWRERTASPKPGEGRLVLFSYDGQLSNRGDTVQLLNASGVVVSTLNVPANPSALQNFLRITEINYNPHLPEPPELAALPGVVDQDFEFIELTNTGLTPLDISGCYFDEGITFTVPASTVIPPGGSVILAKRPQAFAVRYHSDALFNTVLGGYDGNLANGGERLTLREPGGETILSFTYSDTWFKPALGADPTDGNGRTLVIANPKADYTAWDDSGSWRPSAAIGGSPVATPANDISWNYEVWRRAWFTSAERLDPNVSGPAVTSADGLSQTLRYALGLDRSTSGRDKLPAALLVSSGPDTHLALSHRRLKNQLDVTYTVETSTDLVTWTPATTLVGTPVENGDGTETVTYRASTVATPETTSQHIRLRVSLAQ